MSSMLLCSVRIARTVARPSSSRYAVANTLLEQEKARNLQGKHRKDSHPHEHAPGWNEYLASSSEANVKADKDTGSPADLQRKSVEHIKARHHADDVTSGTIEAQYERDEVEGPLKSAAAKVKQTVEEGFEKVKELKEKL